MLLAGRRCLLRPYTDDDIDALARAAGAPDVARWMRHGFPSPYTLADARAWIARQRAASVLDNFAIDVGGELAGGIGILPLADECAGVAEIGYWLAPSARGRGIAADALRTLSAHAFGARGLRRLQAWVFAPNTPSMHVLEAAGYRHEGVRRQMLVDRDGAVHDAVQYGRLASDLEPPVRTRVRGG